MSNGINLAKLIKSLDSTDLIGRSAEYIDDDNDVDDDYDDDEEDGDDGEDTAYGPYASFDQCASEGTLLENQLRTTQLIVKESSGKVITRLKKPRDLYALSNQCSAQMTQRWPVELQFIAKKPCHKHYIPSKPEALYKPAQNMDSSSLPRTSQILGKLVYDNSPDVAIKYFTRSKCCKKSTPVKPYYQLKGPNDGTLLFESRFESGNLMKAIKIGEYDYELWLRFDMYTSKHTQWFYFMVQNARPGVQYRFTIMNFIKPGSLYNDGMRPLMYSELDAEKNGIGWVRAGTKIKYYRNDIRYWICGKERFYYSLTWTCSFANENDTCYFAHCYPYTYTNLQDYLAMLAGDPARSTFLKQRVLCRTLAGNYVYVLTITAPAKRRNEAEIKKAIVISARVHPGETNSSWMMKGFLDFLTSNAPDAKILRENFIFKIIPMLNPDGVIAGNYRCSFAGRDLNRNYKTVLKESFPPIWHTRAMVKKLQEERDILMYCDLHGHSRKKNIFIYGCENKNEKQRRFWGRVFPAMLAKNSPDKFALNHCRFKVQKSKEGTGRIFMWNLGISNSFTMEASFCGSSLGKRQGYHFTIADFESMAYEFCDTLLDFYDPDRSKFHKILSEIVGIIKKVIVERLRASGDEVQPEGVDIEDNLDLLSDIETDSGGSDSSVSDGLPMQLLHASVPELSRKRRLKTRKERNKSLLTNLRSKELDSSKQKSAGTNQLSSTSAKSDRKRSDEWSTNSSAKTRLCYSQRGTSTAANSIPHFVRDRAMEKSKLKKEHFDILAAAFVSNGVDNLHQEIPHCRYTAGISSHYQTSKPCTACESTVAREPLMASKLLQRAFETLFDLSQLTSENPWTEGARQRMKRTSAKKTRCYQSCSEGSDEDPKFSILRRKPVEQYPDALWQQYGSEQNANAVLDIAKRITVYNHRLTQSVSRKAAQAPTYPSTTWQQLVDKKHGELSSNKRFSKNAARWSKQRRQWKEQRAYQISQEQRTFANGLSTPQRLSNHFELTRGKTTAGTAAKLHNRLPTPSNDLHIKRSFSEILSSPSSRRLPQLRISEDTVSQMDEKPMQNSQTENDLHQLSLDPSCSNERVKKTVEIPLKSNSSYRIERTHDEAPSRIDQNEVSLLKDKMLQCGASGLVTYALSVPQAQKPGDSGAWPDISFTQLTAPMQTRSADTLVSSSRALVGKDLALSAQSRESRSILTNDQSSFLTDRPSDLGITLEKTRKLLEGIETNFQSPGELLPNAKDNKTNQERPFANDIFKEGLVTLNVSLNVRPIALNGKDKSCSEPNSATTGKIMDTTVKEPSLEQFAVEHGNAERNCQAIEQQMVLVVQDNSTTGRVFPGTNSNHLELCEKKLPGATSSTFWAKGNRLDPHVRGQEKPFKDSSQ